MSENYSPTPRQLVADVRQRIADHPHGWLPSDVTTMRRLADALASTLDGLEAASDRLCVSDVCSCGHAAIDHHGVDRDPRSGGCFGSGSGHTWSPHPKCGCASTCSDVLESAGPCPGCQSGEAHMCDEGEER